MFVHQNCLRHLLRPRHYSDPRQYSAEVEQIFRPAWHFVATRAELPADGDFLTLELLGVPLLIRNFGGKFVAFKNVCPHRHCMLTCEPRGNSPTLRCQYHGWQFNSEGRTGRIPEAKAFRPWDRDNSHLATVRLELCGDLIFVCLADASSAVSLQQWMSPLFEQVEQAFRGPLWRMAEVWEFDCECNWKVPVENTLESYHVSEVHPKWLGGELPAEANSHHHLEHRYSTLEYGSGTPIEKRQAKICEALGGKPHYSYRHWMIHPHLSFVTTDTFNYVACCQPTSPTTCRVRTRMFPIHGGRCGPWMALVRYVAWRVGRRTMRAVFNEDRQIFGAQQRGLMASEHRGVIGTREERIYTFQRFVCERTGIEVEPDPALQPDSTSQVTTLSQSSSDH